MLDLNRFLTRRRLLACLGIAALLFGLAMLHPYPRQSLFGPTLRGKPWCYWEESVRRDLDPDAYENTITARLMRWLGAKRIELDANDLYGHAEMVPLLVQLTQDPDPRIRRGVLTRILFHNELQDVSALPSLRARLEDEDPSCRIEATIAVVTIDPNERVAPVLQQILDDPDSSHRYEAMRAMTYVACVDPAAFDAMVRHAHDPDPSVRKEIMFELFRHGKKAIPTLLQGLADPDASVRADAIDSLGALGPVAKQGVPALKRLLKDREATVRDAAAEALAAIEPNRGRPGDAARDLK